MAQTDRQTDKPATHWNAAIFDTDDNWDKLKAIPSFVKEVHSQKEICKTTGNPHFQVHVVCHRQVRLTQMCSWIKATKWKPVRGKEYIANSIAYTSKAETAVPGTHQVVHGEKYYQLHELLLEIAKFWEFEDYSYWGGKASHNQWCYITARMVGSDLRWANKLSNPALRRMWEDWQFVFHQRVCEYLEETSGAFIIEAPPEAAPPSAEDEDAYGFIED